MAHHYSNDFPLLRSHGLYAADIRGDGNCLFNALSDQMFGSQDKHDIIRARTIDYMREQADLFKPFMTCYAGGGVRRNPKRKTAGGNLDLTAPTSEEIDRAFHDHLTRMAKGGTWGDNMEIVAFSSAFSANVMIYQRANAYMVRPIGGEDAGLICHIAYHDWEHYSSIRNLDGPHHGLPHVKATKPSPTDLQHAQAEAQSMPDIPQWKVQSLVQSLPYVIDEQTVFQMLKQCNGDFDRAFAKLADSDEQRSVSSQQSSGVDRELDSSDDHSGPNKKQDRRLSRNARQNQKVKQERRKQQIIAANFQHFGKSLESLINVPIPDAALFSFRRPSIATDSDYASSFSPPPLKDGDTSSDSEYSVPSPQVVPLPVPNPSTTGLKIKIITAPAKPAVGIKPNSKRLGAARDAKAAKKLAQKTAAKQRKEAAARAKAKKITPPAQEPAHPSIANGLAGMSLHYI